MRQILNIMEDVSQDRLQVLFDYLSAHGRGEKVDKPSDYDEHVRDYPHLRTTRNLKLVSTEIEYGWLVHFTEYPGPILKSGIHGSPDHRLLGQTRSSEKVPGGFNYAFPIPSKEASYEQSRRSGIEHYGGAALIFQARFIRVMHKGDRQVQAIFLSDEFKPSEAIVLHAEVNEAKEIADQELRRDENFHARTFIYRDGVRHEEQAEWKKTYTPLPRERIIELVRISRQPAILWAVENGPAAGYKGGWAAVVKKVVR